MSNKNIDLNRVSSAKEIIQEFRDAIQMVKHHEPKLKDVQRVRYLSWVIRDNCYGFIMDAIDDLEATYRK